MQRIIGYSRLAMLMIVIVTVGMATSTNGNENATGAPSKVLQKLLTGYDKLALPTELTGVPTEVNINVHVMSSQVDVKTWTIANVLYVRHGWIDKRLQFDESNVARKALYLKDGDCDQVWLPDTFISTEAAPSRVDHRFLRISPPGNVWYVRRMYLTSTLDRSANLFTVPFRFESFAHTTASIVLRPLAYSIEVDGGNAISHKVRSTTVQDCTTNYTSGSYPCLNIEFSFSRFDNVSAGKQFYVFGLLTLLVVVLSSTASWLSPSSTGGLVSRVLIGLVSSVLSFIIIVMRDGYMEQFGTFSACDFLIIGCVLAVVAAFLESVVVIVLVSTKSTQAKKQDDSETAQGQWSDKQRKIDFVAKIAIPVVFAVFGIGFLIILFRN